MLPACRDSPHGNREYDGDATEPRPRYLRNCGTCERQVRVPLLHAKTPLTIVRLLYKYNRGVASVSIRCLAIAAECLTNRLAQEEVLRIFEKIVKETGWQVDFLRIELMEKWGWRQNDNNDNNDTINIHNNDDDDNDNDNNSSLPQQHGQQPPTVSTTPGPSVPPSLLPSSLLNPGSSNPDTSGRSPIPSRPRMPQGIVNPLMATADFSYENHPYQSHYVAPHSHNQMEYSHYESY